MPTPTEIRIAKLRDQLARQDFVVHEVVDVEPTTSDEESDGGDNASGEKWCIESVENSGNRCKDAQGRRSEVLNFESSSASASLNSNEKNCHDDNVKDSQWRNVSTGRSQGVSEKNGVGSDEWGVD